MNIQQPLAIVIGAGRGCATETAVELAARGFDIGLIDAGGGDLEATVNAISGHDSLATVYPVDMSNVGGYEELLDRIVRECGPIACLVNHYAHPRVSAADSLCLSSDSIDGLIDYEFCGSFSFTQAVAARMSRTAARGPRTLITVTSACARPDSHQPSASCLSRTGFRTTRQTFAQRLALLGVGVFEIRISEPLAHAKEPASRNEAYRSVASIVAALASGRIAMPSGSALDVELAHPNAQH